MNVVELEEALFPGGRRTDDFNTKVDELIAAHGRDHIASLLEELAQLGGSQILAELRYEGTVSEIMPLTDEHKRRAAEALERQNDSRRNREAGRDDFRGD